MSIILNHVNYIYGKDTIFEQKALDDIQLEIRDGDFIGLIGHTGSGKSTLVQHLNGLIKPTSGEVYFNGQDIHDSDYDRKALRSQVGLVFQYPEHQLFEVDVFSDVCYGPKNLGLSKKEAELRAYEALKQVGLSDDYFYMSPFDLSGGEKRRVAIAGVLAMKPAVLILDEPFVGLDPKASVILKDIMHQICADGGAIFFSTHVLDVAEKLCNKVAIIKDGRLVTCGDMEQVVAKGATLESIFMEVVRDDKAD